MVCASHVLVACCRWMKTHGDTCASIGGNVDETDAKGRERKRRGNGDGTFVARVEEDEEVGVCTRRRTSVAREWMSCRGLWQERGKTKET